MEQKTLNASLREKVGGGPSNALRLQGRIPAVFYGKNQTPIHLSVDASELEKAVSTDLGLNTILNLKVKDGGAFSVIIKDYQADPVDRHFLHADFISIDLSKKIRISVPIKLGGRPEGIKEGGILEQVTREIMVECLPMSIPKNLEVDVTPLKIGQSIHMNDITLPEGVELCEKTNLTIASVVAQKEEEPVAEAMVEPEVLTAKKAEEKEEAKTTGKDEGVKKESKGEQKKEEKAK